MSSVCMQKNARRRSWLGPCLKQMLLPSSSVMDCIGTFRANAPCLQVHGRRDLTPAAAQRRAFLGPGEGLHHRMACSLAHIPRRPSKIESREEPTLPRPRIRILHEARQLPKMANSPSFHFELPMPLFRVLCLVESRHSHDKF